MNTSIAVLLEHKDSTVHTVSPTLTVAEAVQVMIEKKVSSVLVMEQKRLVGIFTERDVLRRVIGANLDPKATKLRDVMSTGLATISPATTLKDTMEIFSEKHCRHLPVISGEQLVGVISIGDVSRWLTNLHRAEAEQLRDYISGGYSG